MSQSPNPPTTPITRIAVAGAILGVVGIVLFLVLYSALSNTADLPRLLISLCVPPAVMAILLGIYLLVTARTTSNDDTSK